MYIPWTPLLSRKLPRLKFDVLDAMYCINLYKMQQNRKSSVDFFKIIYTCSNIALIENRHFNKSSQRKDNTWNVSFKKLIVMLNETWPSCLVTYMYNADDKSLTWFYNFKLKSNNIADFKDHVVIFAILYLCFQFLSFSSWDKAVPLPSKAHYAKFLRQLFQMWY